MLVLNRKVGESILIGEDIEIIITGIEEGKVRVGIRAPRAVNIVRREVLEAVRKENQASSQSFADPTQFAPVFRRPPQKK